MNPTIDPIQELADMQIERMSADELVAFIRKRNQNPSIQLEVRDAQLADVRERYTRLRKNVLMWLRDTSVPVEFREALALHLRPPQPTDPEGVDTLALFSAPQPTGTPDDLTTRLEYFKDPEFSGFSELVK